MTQTNEETIVLRLLKAAGMPEDLAKEAYKDLRVKRNAAFIDNVLKALEEDLQSDTKNKLDTLDEYSPEKVLAVLNYAAQTSKNKPNIASIAAQCEQGVTQAFFAYILDNASKEGRDTFDNEFEKIIEEDTQTGELVISYLESFKK